MANWGGTFRDYTSDNPEYYLYLPTDYNVPAPPAQNWPIFPNNANDPLLPANREFPMRNELSSDQSCSSGYYRVDSNVPANQVPMANSYHDQSVNNTMDGPQVSRNMDYMPNVAKPSQHFPPAQSRSGNNYDRRGMRNNNKRSFQKDGPGTRPDIAVQSNLQATASEFVPNRSKMDREKNRQENVEVSTSSAQDPNVKDSRLKPGTSDASSSHDRGRYDRRYDNRRGNSGYKQREGQYGQFQRGNTYKNNYRQRTRSYNKFQGDTYANSRHRPEDSEEGAAGIDGRRSSVERSQTFDACNSDESGPSRNVWEEESFSNANMDTNRDRGFGRDTNEGESSRRDNTQHTGKVKKYNNQVNEYVYQNSGSRQSQGYSKNMKKQHSVSMKQDRYENGYKEKRYTYRSNGNRGSYEKENKPESSRENDSRGKSAAYEPVEPENWRIKKENPEKDNLGYKEKTVSQKRGQSRHKTVDDDASQRERLTDQLNKGKLECLVCCENIVQTNYVWSCSNCYHVLHLKCIKKWAKSSTGENGWRCPACQNVNSTIPEEYFCFCGKTRAPEWNRRDVAHSCGEVCGRTLSKNCVHKCTLLCHPGSCPSCIAMVTKNCGCGRMSQTLQCSAHTLLLCDSICGKDLNCGKHKCEKKCHHGECGRCESKVEQVCYCGKNKREVICQSNVSTVYACKAVCARLLNCGNHKCEQLCHPDDCEPCSLTPDKVTTCCCGQTELTEKRESCLDSIPTCDKVCSKNLKCGQPNNPHTCKANCHKGACPDCDLTTDVKCRCGNMDREIACKDLTSKADDARCEKRCTKKRSCGKHKCNQLCCIDIEHICPLPCSKTLSCGRHKCEQSCHKGRCQPCWRSSFDELYCECGAAVIYPPVPCGTRRPACDRPCSRQHDCGHEVLHNCHSEPTCPPCTVLTQRWCYGKHELRKAVPCYVSEISCGLPCSKPLSCGRHKCVTTCHSGPCERQRQQCSQPCTTPRQMCGHPCAAQCHDGKCPDTPCKEMVKVTCQCGHRTMSRACAENSREYQRIASSILASKMADMQLGHSIDLEEVFGQGAKKQNQLKTLECNDECKIIERNRRLVLGLQIINPDLNGKLMPRYSDFMKEWAKKDPHFCQMVHEKLTELVQLAKTSKQKSRSYSFDSMNKDKRLFVHESCEHFGCESQAYDPEPNRNVVATAVKDKCWLPSYSLLEIVKRENGRRKVPGPMLNTSKADGPMKTVLSLPVRKSQKAAMPSSSKIEPEIDYFDYQG